MFKYLVVASIQQSVDLNVVSQYISSLLPKKSTSVIAPLNYKVEFKGMLHGVVKVNFPSNLESFTKLEPLIKVKTMEGTVH